VMVDAHRAIETEACDRVIEIGLVILQRPILQIAIGRDAGNLHADILAFGNVGDPGPPGLIAMRLDVGHAAMVEDESDIGREIDKRLRYLTKRLENAVVVDPGRQENLDQVFFGARVSIIDADGNPIAQKNVRFIEKLLKFDAIVIAGQAKSHCVAWTIDDLLTEILAQDASLAKKVYLLEDCTSPVVVPGVIDYTDQADAAFKRFADAGMRVVNTATPIEDWPGIEL